MAENLNPVGMAVIGYGGMGKGHHVDHIQKTLGDYFRITGVFDSCEVRRQFANENGVHAYESREALLRDPAAELVVVATPNDVHEEIVIDALRHGKHVICEKPVTLSGASLERMIAAANKSKTLFTVHQNRRWDGDYLTAKKLIESNTLGRVFNIESRVHGSRGVPGDWRALKAYGGGMVLDWGIHMLDQMLQLMRGRRLLSLYAQMTTVTCDEVDDGFRVLCTFEGDVTFMVEILTSNFISLPRWYILGENGSAEFDWNRDGKIVKVSDWENRESVPVQLGVGITKTMAPRTAETIQSSPIPKVDGAWSAYYENIFDVIRNGAQPVVTHDEQRRLIRLVEAIFESGRTNRVVEVE
ncbi:MAG: Gfo/Idh/MocA family oxidoreductase [Oscillospiraceae bacterium]|jgi:predicted dehydrogenase|nr:Gfo/Idh/MocA family oxidoreductase [Oscillospiraceae bacterium]